MRRRLFGQALCAAGAMLAGCADAPVDAARPAPRDGDVAFVTPWRSVIGGFIAPVAPALGMQARPGTGMFVKLHGPTALALRGSEMLVADAASGRVWRADLSFNTLTPLPGAPVGPGTALLLGNDLSAWVLDAAARQVLRFARDGRLLQTWRTGSAAPAPVAIALLDAGATLLVGDATLATFTELRSGGALALPVLPQRANGERMGVDAIAAGRDGLFVLDRAVGAVHRVQRDGRLVETLGTGALAQPGTMVVDRHDRVFVLDAFGRSVTVLRSGAAPRVLQAAELGVQQIGGLAVDEGFLAVSDRLAGQVQIHTLAPEPRP